MKKSLLTFLAALFISSLAVAQIRPYDKKGLNVFENPKVDTTGFTKVNVKIGISIKIGNNIAIVIFKLLSLIMLKKDCPDNSYNFKI